MSRYLLFTLILVLPLIPIESYSQEETIEMKADKLIEQLVKIQKESKIANQNDSYLFLVGLLVAVVAICSSMYYAYLMTKQVKYQKEEVRHTLRPILARREYKDTNQTWLLHMGSEISDENKHFKIRIGNIGNTPAVSISITRRFDISGENSREESKKSSMMAPGEVIDYYFKVSPEEVAKILDADTYHFDIRIIYGEISSMNINYEYYMKGHFEKAELFVDEVQTK